MSLAAYLEDVLRGSIPDAEVFRTSRPGQLRSGTGWFNEIEREIKRADAFVVLVTPQSQDRWWVLFEAGAAFRSGRTFVPVLAGDLKPEDVNEPLTFLTLRRLQDPADAAQAFTELGGALVQADEFAKRVGELAAASARDALRADSWQKVEMEGRTFAWAGPLSQLPLEAPVEEPPALQALLELQGLEITRGFLHDPVEGSRGFAPVFFVDEWNARHHVMHPQRQVLWVKRRNH